MKKHLSDGTIEISGNDLANLAIVVHDSDVINVGQAAARRVEAARLRKNRATWSQAKKLALNAEPTPEMLKVARERLGRGWNFSQAIEAAMTASAIQRELIMRYQVQDTDGVWHDVTAAQYAAYRLAGVPVRVI